MAGKCEKIWRCRVCGYEHRGEAPPECCPSCGAAASEFEEVGECAASNEVWHDVGAFEDLKTQKQKQEKREQKYKDRNLRIFRKIVSIF